MKIKEYKVYNLFGLFDHEIFLDHPERVVIVRGPNGFGKTTMLQLLESLFEGKKWFILTTKFDKVEIVLESPEGKEIRILIDKTIETSKECAPEIVKMLENDIKDIRRRRRIVDSNPDEFFGFLITVTGNKQKPERYVVANSATMLMEPSKIARIVAQRMPSLERIGVSLWRDTRLGRHYNVEDLMDRYPSVFNFSTSNFIDRYGDPFEDGKLEDWADSLQKLLPPVRLVSADRLRSRIEKEGINVTAEKYSEEMRSKIQLTLQDYGSSSQAFDVGLLNSVLRAGQEEPSESAEELAHNLAGLQKRLADLKKAGLWKEDAQIPQKADLEIMLKEEFARSFWSSYYEGLDNKLEEIEKVAGRIELLVELVNKHFMYIRLKVDAEVGFVISSSGNEDSISPSQLSSGEQHMIVMLYDMLFKTERGSLLLIDEPELSLHPSWLSDYVDDVLRIIKEADISVVLATHSPDIVGSHRYLSQVLSPREKNVDHSLHNTEL